MDTNSKRSSVRVTRLKSFDIARLEAAVLFLGGTRAEFVRGAALRMAEGLAR